MNNTFVTARVRYADTATANGETIRNTVYNLVKDTSLTNEQAIDKMFLATLSRYPSAAEKAKVLTYFTSMTKQAALESLQWILLNKVDFIFNY